MGAVAANTVVSWTDESLSQLITSQGFAIAERGTSFPMELSC
jgi:hypothetical protein